MRAPRQPLRLIAPRLRSLRRPLDEIASVKATGLTFAPEAGTQRMRNVVNKNITDEDIEMIAERVRAWWKRMKLYFMIGLPTEEDEDVEGIVHTANRLRKIGRQHHGKRAEVTASASSHVPKPHTPFQWAAMDSYDEIVRKHGVLKDIGRKFRITVKTHNPKATSRASSRGVTAALTSSSLPGAKGAASTAGMSTSTGMPGSRPSPSGGFQRAAISVRCHSMVRSRGITLTLD